MDTTVGQIMINNALPESMRDYSRVLDKKAVTALFFELADNHPELYAEVSLKLHKIGEQVSTVHGNEASISLNSLKTPPAVQKLHQEINQGIEKILAGEGDSKTKDRDIVDLISRYIDPVTKTNYAEALKERNPFAVQILSGSRGNTSQFRALRGGDMLVVDHKDRPIPIPILSSFSEGLDPVQYWAGAYGARKGTIATKFCVLGETLVRMADWSVKQISDLVSGEWVVGSDYFGNTFPVKVTRIFNNGTRECWRYDFELKRSARKAQIIATPDHEVLARITGGRDGPFAYRSVYTPSKLQLRRTSSKDFVAAAPLGYVYEGADEPRALLLGLLLGDGCMQKTLVLSCGYPSMMQELTPYMNSLGLRVHKAGGDNYNYTLTYLKNTRDNGAQERRLHPIKQWLDSLELRFKLAYEKFIPRAAWSWSNRSVAALLGGLISTDGSVYLSQRNRTVSIALCLTSKQLVQDAKELLEWRFGIYSNDIDDVCMSGKKWAKHAQYKITISNWESVKRFHQLIPLVGKKRDDLERCMVDRVAGTKEDTPGFKCRHKEPAGLLPTYDLEVDHPDHLFVLANGLIVGNSTPKSGFLGKQLAMATHRLMVTENDCGTSNGIPVSASDGESEGALLARDAGQYKAGTILTPKILKELGDQKILVRSPMTCHAEQGVCRRCSGIRERGGFPPLGDNIGIAASQSISEPIGQAQLSTKHSGGQASGQQRVGKSGIDLVNQIVQVPKTFQGAASVASADGTVDRIDPAPQGGQYLTIAGHQHWVPPGEELTIGKGDSVEAGDILSSGIPNPAEIVRHKGIGEGRRYFMEQFRKTLADNKMPAHRRNIELLSRGLINHVRITDPDGPADTTPDDVVEYDGLVRGYQPRFGFQMATPKTAKGLYLEEPVLHYSIGTRVTPKTAAIMTEHGVGPIKVHADPPSFAPEMVRAMETMSHAPDWMVRLGGFNLSKGFKDSTHHNQTSDTHGTSFIPALAQGVEFGKPPKGRVGY